MHVLGVDIGSHSCVLATVGPDSTIYIVTDTDATGVASELFPAIVGFDGNRRLFGNSAKSLEEEKIISDLKRSLVSNEGPRQVTYKGALREFETVQLFGMLLSYFKVILEKEVNEIGGICIGCPLYFTAEHKAVVKRAATIAGFNHAYVINDMKASIRAYCNCDLLPMKKNGCIAFVDVGHSSMQIAVAYVWQEKYSIFAEHCDSTPSRDVINLMKTVLGMSKKKASDINWVEICGSRADEKSFNSLVRLFTKNKCRQTIIPKQSVARGCALLCSDGDLLEVEVEIDDTMRYFIDEESQMVVQDSQEESIWKKVEMDKLNSSISKYRNMLDSKKADEAKFLRKITTWQKGANSDKSSVDLRSKAKMLDRGFNKLLLKRCISEYKETLSCLENLSSGDTKFIITIDEVLNNLGIPDEDPEDEEICSPSVLSKWTETLNSKLESLRKRIGEAPRDDKNSKPKVAEIPRKEPPKKISLTETINHEFYIPYDSGPATGYAGWNYNTVIQTCYFKAHDPESLLNICAGHANVITLLGFIPENEAGYNVATEKVLTYQEFFRKEWDRVLCDYTSKKDLEGCPSIFQMWWEGIESKFRIFFRGLIEAVLYLHDHNVVVDSNSIYITTFGHARVLPSGLAPENKASNHVLVVKEAIHKVLTLPFDEKVGKFEVNLPVELQVFLTRKEHKIDLIMESLSDSILIYESYFWTIDERIQFMNRMSHVLKSVDAFKDNWDANHYEQEDWDALVDSYEDKKYRKNLDDWTTYSGIYNYSNEPRASDIIRFINALYSHINNKHKRNATDQEQRCIIELYDLEEEISSMFKDVYCNAMTAIYDALFIGILKIEDQKIKKFHTGLFCPGGILRPSNGKRLFEISIAPGQKGFILESWLNFILDSSNV